MSLHMSLSRLHYTSNTYEATQDVLPCCFQLLHVRVIDFLGSRNDDSGQGAALLVIVDVVMRSAARIRRVRSSFANDALTRLDVFSKRWSSGTWLEAQPRDRQAAWAKIVETLHRFLPASPNGRELPDRLKDRLRCPRHTQAGITQARSHFAPDTLGAMHDNANDKWYMDNLWQFVARYNWARVRHLLPEIVALGITTNAS